MDYSIEYNPYWSYKRVQDFEYLDIESIEYSFEYTRNILSDLAKFNAPVFARRVRRGFNFNKGASLSRKNVSNCDATQHSSNVKALELKRAFIVNNNVYILNDKNENYAFKNKTYLLSQENAITNKFKLLFGDTYENITNINGILTLSQDIKKSFISHMYGGQTFIYGNIFEWKHAKLKYDKIANFYEPLKSFNIYKYLNKYETYALELPHELILNIYKTIELYKKDEVYTLNKYKTILANKIPDIYDANIFKIKPSIKIQELNANKFKNILLEKGNHNGFVFKDIHGYKIPDVLQAQTDKVYSLTKHKYLYGLYDYDIRFGKKIPKYSDLNKIISGKTLIHNRRTYKNDILMACKKVIKKSKLSYRTLLFKKIRKKTFIRKHLFSKRKIYKITKISSNTFLFNTIDELMLNKINTYVFKKRRPFNIGQTEMFIYKKRKCIRINYTEQFLYKLRKPFRINDTESFIYKLRKPIRVNNTEVFLYKNIIDTSKEIVIFDTNVFIYKNKKPVRINHTEQDLYKLAKEFNINDLEKSVYKLEKPLYFIDKSEEFGTKLERPLSPIYNTGMFADKQSYSFKRLDDGKTFIRLPYNLMLDDNSIGFVLDKKGIKYSETLTGLNKVLKDIYVNEANIFVHKESKPLMFDETELWLFKLPKELPNEYYDLHATMTVSLIKHLVIKDDSMFVEKVSKDSIINNIDYFLYKLPYRIYVPDNISMSLIKNISTPQDNVFLYKLPKEIYIQNSILMSKIIKEMFLQDTLILEKCVKFDIYNTDLCVSSKVKEVFIDKDNIWLSKPIYTNIFKQYSLEKNEFKGLIEESSNVSIMKNESDIMIDKNSVFISKLEYETNELVNELQRLQAVVKELEKPIEHTYNWAWVWEPDNPIPPNDEDYYGLDELLLPEKDVDYSEFEDDIFNKNKMTPRNPVKIIDDTTFIAKYPIKHPTPDYEEVGIVYIDVPSELMYRIFCKYYEVWYANIFKFGNMSMVDSLRMMLDFMYSWIILTYTGTEYLVPALRVFRQIRWFGEKSIMHNAQYLISYDKADLKCDLYSGTLKEIKNDLDTNNTFYINKTLGVIANNSTYYSQDAYINLYLDFSVDTVLTFNIRQAGGETRIYLDASYIDVITSASKKVSVTIPSGTHTLRIFRPAINNFATCYIGAITIVGGSFTNLQITYDPELKLGNMPLNDVAQKMLQFASLYDNSQEAFERYRKGNLGVSQLYKELKRYWELHHQNKIKGKRLTIKET